MGSTQSVSVDLPDELYQRIREIAERNDRSVESVLRESLETMFGGIDLDVESMRLQLETYRDDQLWAVVYRRVAWPRKERLRELTALGQSGSFSAQEQVELEALLDRVDRYTLLRSYALRLLQQRGHDVEHYLAQGA